MSLFCHYFLLLFILFHVEWLGEVGKNPRGGGGGSLPLEIVPDAQEKKTRVKWYQNQGSCGAEREKGVKIAKNGEKGYPNRDDQNSSQAIIRGKGR